MKSYVDGLSPDGEVERFDAVRYAAAQWKGKLVSVGFVLGAIGLFFSSRKKKRSQPGVQGILADWRKTWNKLFKRSSKAHLYTVGLIILVGVILRAMMLSLPIMYDEAFTYTYFACKPLQVIVSDYSYPNNHIFHTLLVKLSTSLFGVGLIQLRLPAFIAGVLCLPAVYIFTRAMFNRYIALTALALAAAVGGLVEFSAIARGYSITWLCMLIGLMLARHLIKTNNSATSILLGMICALGMWTVPTMIYVTLFIYVSILLLLLGKYESTLQERLQKLILSFVVFLFTTALFYSPVVIMNTVDQLFYHPTMGENTWDGLTRSAQDRFTDMIYYWSYSSNQVISGLGIIGLIFAGFISSKFRVILFSALLGTIPLVLVQGVIGPPRIWNFVLFVYCIGVAIALFYFMKFVDDKLIKIAKRKRTIAISLLALGLFAVLSVSSLSDRYYRYPEAARLADVISAEENPGTVALVKFPWEAPLEFHLIANGTGRSALYEKGAPGTPVYIVVAPVKGQTIENVLEHHELVPEHIELHEEFLYAGKQVELHQGTLKHVGR